MEPAHPITERELIAIAVSLGAPRIRGWSKAEQSLASTARPAAPDDVRLFRKQILSGQDPLGQLFCLLRSPADRRSMGAVYTPDRIIQSMIGWAADYGEADRVIDPGAGSGRFLLAAARKYTRAQLIGVEIDPLAAILARANLAVHDLHSRSFVALEDYRSFTLNPIPGRTLFVGNPPYVRHHQITTEWKQWLVDTASARGIDASQLAGLHTYFFLATLLKAKPSDFGAFITAAEWLDVNYGHLVRQLFLGDLGGKRLVVIEPEAMPFPDAATTAAVAYFDVGSRPRSIRLKRVTDPKDMNAAGGTHVVRRERLESEDRWSHLTHSARKEPGDFIELGELCRVHRGQVTGANRIWIAGEHSIDLPEAVLFPTVTKALELFRAGMILSDASLLRRVIDLPTDLDVFDPPTRKVVDRFLAKARQSGADRGYIASKRRAWWSVGLKTPAPILATYMARRPPAFVRNNVAARHINIAHGLYPREPLSETAMTNLVYFLSTRTHRSAGRTYAGGLTKFEPREMERLLIPDLATLSQMTQ